MNDAHKVAFRGMQALNTSGLLELMESIGATGECQVKDHFLNGSKNIPDRVLC